MRGRTTAHQPDCAKQPHHAASGWAFILDTDDPMALTHMLTSLGTAADPAPAAGPALATDAVPYEPTHRHP